MRPEDKWNAGSCDELRVNFRLSGSKLKKSDPQDICTNSIKCQERQIYFTKSQGFRKDFGQDRMKGTEVLCFSHSVYH